MTFHAAATLEESVDDRDLSLGVPFPWKTQQPTAQLTPAPPPPEAHTARPLRVLCTALSAPLLWLYQKRSERTHTHTHTYTYTHTYIHTLTCTSVACLCASGSKNDQNTHTHTHTLTHSCAVLACQAPAAAAERADF